MIRLNNVCKQYPTRHGPRVILDDINIRIDAGQCVGILGRNGAGKSTLIRLIGGVETPTSGTVERTMSVSWPLAFGGTFQTTLTGFDNFRFICRVYNVCAEDNIAFVQEFSELGEYLKEPVRSYSAGMRARLAFAISMVVDFDCYLIDEIIAVGDSRFHQKCHDELFEKRVEKAKIIVSHDAHFITTHCEKAAVLDNGKLSKLEDTSEAFSHYY